MNVHRKRIYNEFNSYRCKKNDSSSEILKITLSGVETIVYFLYKNQKINVFLNSYYPFNAPKRVVINGIDYNGTIDICKESSMYFKKYMNINCMCCDTCLCMNNWTPTIYLIDIIDEFLLRKNIDNTIKTLNMINYSKNIPDEIIKYIRTFLLEY
jgi:hypothetical protein